MPLEHDMLTEHLPSAADALEKSASQLQHCLIHHMSEYAPREAKRIFWACVSLMKQSARGSIATAGG